MDNFKVGSNETLISDGWKSLSVSKLLITPWEINKWSETPSHQEQSQHKMQPQSCCHSKRPNNQPQTTSPEQNQPCSPQLLAQGRPREQGQHLPRCLLPRGCFTSSTAACWPLKTGRKEAEEGKEAFKNATRLSGWW